MFVQLLGACSAFTTRCSPHARRVTKVTLYTEGFSRFVTSTTAPIATGRSESCRMGLSPTGKSRLCTAHVEDGSKRAGFVSRRTNPAPLLVLADIEKVLTQDDAIVDGAGQTIPSHY